MFTKGLHHVALICSDYPISKKFYSEIMGFKVLHEVFRKDRDSWKLDLAIDENTQLELFSFPNPPARASRPESCGLRHLALKVASVEGAIKYLATHGIVCEPLRRDEYTQRLFTFFSDPDGLPLELYEVKPADL